MKRIFGKWSFRMSVPGWLPALACALAMGLWSCNGSGSEGAGTVGKASALGQGGSITESQPIANGSPAAGELVLLGKAIFFDPTLSKPVGQSCASCHDPAAGFADAGADQGAMTGTAVQLDGGSSSDPDGNAITYRWSFVTVPMKMPMGGGMPMVSQAVFSDAGAEAPTFVPDLPGIYDIALTVTDGELSSVDLVQIAVAAP